jgi:L-malate glycosyltransferase
MSRGGALRVVHVDTERSWGGGQRQLHALATGLQRRGHQSWVVARFGTLLAEALIRDGIPVVPVSPAFEWDPVAVNRVRVLLQRVRPDVVHAHAGHAVAIAALATAGTEVPLLVTRRVALPLRRNPLSRWKYARPARFIAVSHRVRSVLRTGGVAADRISVVYSGVDVARAATPARAATLRGLGLDPGRPLVVMVSSLVPPHKDPETFLVAIAAVRSCGGDVQALLVGEGPLAAATNRMRDRLGLAGSVRLAGFRGDAVELLAAADVAVLSSRDEGLGTTLLDAMVAGVPVAATAAGGVPEVVRDGVDGLLVPVGDGAALGAAIRRLLGERDVRTALVAAARERVKRFSIDHTVDGTLEVYGSLERSGHGGRWGR